MSGATKYRSSVTTTKGGGLPWIAGAMRATPLNRGSMVCWTNRNGGDSEAGVWEALLFRSGRGVYRSVGVLNVETENLDTVLGNPPY